MIRTIHFTAYGRPQQQGSKAPWGSEANRNLAPWRGIVAKAAADALDSVGYPKRLALSEVKVIAEFYFKRPKSHYYRNGSVKIDAPRYHASAPDVDKCIRGILDAMTGIVYHDDRQVVAVSAEKFWTAGRECATITVIWEANGESEQKKTSRSKRTGTGDRAAGRKAKKGRQAKAAGEGQ